MPFDETPHPQSVSVTELDPPASRHAQERLAKVLRRMIYAGQIDFMVSLSSRLLHIPANTHDAAGLSAVRVSF